ncbi:hypothetical protein [Sphingomonas molluscorum]|uniref:hypothetical protein n=1 Tax=Sphingomonas molluscorum TaxID=418184 RepID=UPI0031D2B213
MFRSNRFGRLACCVAVTMVAPQGHARSPDTLLQPSTIEDWRAVGMDGTGCYWSARRNGPVLFAAAGQTAVTKVAGRVVVLAPAPEARELFPFTYDAWTSDRLTIRVNDSGVVRAMGEETVTTDALLIVTAGAKARRMRGSLICGS